MKVTIKKENDTDFSQYFLNKIIEFVLTDPIITTFFFFLLIMGTYQIFKVYQGNKFALNVFFILLLAYPIFLLISKASDKDF